MKYRRLKTVADHSFVLRYYKLTDAVAYCNAFYKIVNGEATKIDGLISDGNLVGFSHGGNNLAEGMILLDINTQALYMGLLEDGDSKPAIGDLVNGYQRVVDTHYETESAEGKNDDGFGEEYLNVPYYLFTIEQPTATSTQTITDTNAGEISGADYKKTTPTPTPEPEPTTYSYNLRVKNISTSAAVIKTTGEGGGEETFELGQNEEHSFGTFTSSSEAEEYTLGSSFGFTSVKVYASDGTTEVVDITNHVFNYANQVLDVAVPTDPGDTP